MKIAVIGVGYVGKEHARLYAELPDVELAGVVDVLRPRAEEVAALYKTTPFTDYREILGKVDAATLASMFSLRSQSLRISKKDES